MEMIWTLASIHGSLSSIETIKGRESPCEHWTLSTTYELIKVGALCAAGLASLDGCTYGAGGCVVMRVVAGHDDALIGAVGTELELDGARAAGALFCALCAIEGGSAVYHGAARARPDRPRETHWPRGRLVC